jgi:hypothetical protein
LDDPEKLKLRDLLGYFTAKQLWALAGALVGLVVTSFAAGVWLSSQTNSLTLAGEKIAVAKQLQEKEDTIKKLAADHERATKDLKFKLSESEKIVSDAKQTVGTFSKERSWLLLKAEFLEHYLRYELAMPAGLEERERTSRLFIGFVSRLWKTQEDNAVKVAMGLATPSDFPVVSRPIVAKPANPQQRIIKTVTFPDGSSYTVPYEIASAVHRRE